MAYIEHTRITWGGSLGSAVTAREIWQCGLRLDVDSGDWGALSPPQAFMDDVAEAVRLFHLNSSNATDSAWLEYVRGACVNPAGREIGIATFGDDVFIPTAGFQTTNRHPFQVACVVTMHHVGIGRGNYGRVYLPTPGIATTRDGLISQSDANGVRDGFDALLTAINAAVVAAGVSGKGVRIISRSGTVKSIDQLAVGRVLDTQRRRRNRLDDSKEFVDFP